MTCYLCSADNFVERFGRGSIPICGKCKRVHVPEPVPKLTGAVVTQVGSVGTAGTWIYSGQNAYIHSIPIEIKLS